MTPFRLLFEEGPLGAHGHATYTPSDLALVYAPTEDQVPAVHLKRARAIDARFGIYDHPVFLIAGTLALRFDEDRTLVALDAYTNDKLWARKAEESQAKSQGRGRLKIDWHSDSDRVLLPGAPRFALTPSAQRLHIYLESAPPPEVYYEVGTSLTVGLAAGAIREIIIADLTVV